MTLRGVVLFAGILCSTLPFSLVEAASGQVSPAARQTGQRVQAQLEARRAARLPLNDAQPNDAGGTVGAIIETIAGAVPFQQPVNALKTGLGQIQSIAEDSKGNLYVGSCDMGVVLKVDSSSNVTVYAGQPLPTGPAQAVAMAVRPLRHEFHAL